jgi:hypothetical protein
MSLQTRKKNENTETEIENIKRWNQEYEVNCFNKI